VILLDASVEGLFVISLNDQVACAMNVPTKSFQMLTKKVNGCIKTFNSEQKHRLHR
jgi:hypothetical protein